MPVRPDLRLLAISDAACRGGEAFAAWVGRLVAAGVGALHIREKAIGDRDLLALVTSATAVGGDRLAVLVNGRPDVALAGGAAGVHLPADGLPVAAVRRRFPGLLVGRSTHTAADVAAAAADGADYVVFGPVWASPGKGAGVGLAALAEACGHGVPVLALGGLDPARVAAAGGAGAAGVAGIRAVHAADLSPLVAAVQATFVAVAEAR